MEGICFCSAAYGGWGIVRVGTLVPESHSLFICPFSCGRHNAVGAELHGYRDRLSYLFIDEKDIALGTIPEDIMDAVTEILAEKTVRPKVILLYFSCVLYMSGFDWNAISDDLIEMYPDISFQICLMNPIAVGGKKPPALTMHQSLCDLWGNSQEKDNGLNLLGCYVPPPAESELYNVLEKCGIVPFRHFTFAESFEKYREMSRSSYNLVVRPEGTLAAKSRAAEMKTVFTPITYDLDQIKDQYGSIFNMIGEQTDLAPFLSDAENSIGEALKQVERRKIAVGSSAVCRPFSLARALMKYGFLVSDVFTEGCPAYEKESFDYLRENCSDIVFHDIHSPDNYRNIGQIGSADIAIGYSAGYYTGVASVVDLVSDEGMFGFHGVKTLMEKLGSAVTDPRSLEPMIESYGLIV